MRFGSLGLLLASASALAACATTPTGSTVQPSHPSRPSQPGVPTQPYIPQFALAPARFEDLPGWSSTDLAPALIAFRRSCDGRRLASPDSPISNAGRYGGNVGMWSAACAAAASVQPGGERAFFEANFIPYAVQGSGEARLTAYFEPTIQARRAPEPGFTEPLLHPPSDMVFVDLGAFAQAYDNQALHGGPRRLTGKIVGNQVEPYPARTDITAQPGQAFAYANAVDVYNLQIQGSGRLVFPDGTQERAAFAAQNGYAWSSALAALRDSGELPSPTWANFRTWSQEHGDDATHAALNADPSYVFFNEEIIQDVTAGPRGAAGVNLTAMGSMAVDPDFHPYGALIYVDGQYNGAAFDHLLVAQDTGGAIRRGPLRGDVFFGSGPDAGAAAQTMNGPARWWTMLPRGVPVS